MKTLIIIDLQKDFYDPAGSLYVKGAEVIPGKVAGFVDGYDNVIFTLDFHPFEHCSFKENGGIWPEHCVQYSWGASLPDEVLAAIDKKVQRVSYYIKGDRSYEEEYAAFGRISDSMLKTLKDSGSIEICGLCGDYCVGLSVERLIELGLKDKLVLNMDCVGSIDGGASINELVAKYGLVTK